MTEGMETIYNPPIIQVMCDCVPICSTVHFMKFMYMASAQCGYGSPVKSKIILSCISIALPHLKCHIIELVLRVGLIYAVRI